MRRSAFAALLTPALILAACGNGGDAASTRSAPPPARAAPTAEQVAASLATLPAPYAEADLDNGRRMYARCRACHTVTEGGSNMTGPNLWGVFGREAGTVERFNYSRSLSEADFTWDPERLDHWLENPRTFLPGNRMSFPGAPNATDRRDLIAWLMIETGYAPGDAPPAAG